MLEIDRRTGHLSIDEAFAVLRSGSIDAYEQMLSSEDAAEGPMAFSEGRDPQWKGR